MKSNGLAHHWIKHIPHLYYGILFYFAIIFFKERIVFLDTAVYFYEFIQFREFLCPHHRYINIFTEFLPLMGSYLGLPLKSLAIIYSVSFVLVSYLVFIISTYIFRVPVAGWANAIIATCGVAVGYFYPVSEVHSGLSMLCLLIAFLLSERVIRYKPWVYWSVFFGILFFTLFSHPTVLAPTFLFIISWSIFKNKLLSKNRLIVMVVVTGIMFLIRYLSIDGYERGFSKGLLEGVKVLGEYEKFWSFNYLAMIGWKVMIANGVIFLISSIFMIARKKWLAFMIYLCTCIILFFLPFLTHSVNWVRSAAIEISFYPFTLATLFPLLLFYKELGKMKYALMVFSLAPFYFLVEITTHGAYYNKHLEQKELIVERLTQLPGAKFYTERDFIPSRQEACWTYATETLLLSAMNHPDHQVTIYADPHPAIVDNRTNLIFLMTSPFNGIHTISQCNEKYFYGLEGEYTKVEKDFFEGLHW